MKQEYRFLVDYVSDMGAWGTGELADLEPEAAEWMARDLGIEVVELVGEVKPPIVSDGQDKLKAKRAEADTEIPGKEEIMHSGNMPGLTKKGW